MRNSGSRQVLAAQRPHRTVTSPTVLVLLVSPGVNLTLGCGSGGEGGSNGIGEEGGSSGGGGMPPSQVSAALLAMSVFWALA